MGRRASTTKVKRHHVYTTQEAAATVNRDQRTVLRWIKDGGLHAATDKRPWLIRGDDLKDWLDGRIKRRRRPLGSDEIHCMACRRPVRPAGDMVDYVEDRPRRGRLVGICPCCNRMIHRFVGRAEIPAFERHLEVTFA